VNSVAYSPDSTRIVSTSAGYDQQARKQFGEIKVWQAATGRNLLTLKGYTDDVRSVAYSSDGKRIISGGSEVKVWDAQMGQGLSTLEDHADPVSSVAISPDGNHIISGSKDGTVKVWDTQSGQVLLTLKGHTGAVNSVAICPDGKRIVSGSDDQKLKVWDAATGEVLFTHWYNTQGVLGVAFSPDGKLIVSGNRDRSLRVWDAHTGQDRLPVWNSHRRPVSCVAFSPDGKRIVSGSQDHTLKVWNANTVKELLTLKGHTSAVNSAAFSPDGKRIVSASDEGTLKVWDALTGQELLNLKGHMRPVTSVVYSPDGRRIISGGLDDTLKVWDAATGQHAFTIRGHKRGVTSVAFSGDGRYLVSGSQDKTQRVWDASSGQVDLKQQASNRLYDLERLARWSRFDPDWHRRHAEAAEKAGDAFAAVFHLDRLLAGLPSERPALLARRTAVLWAALARDASAPSVLVALGRSTVVAEGSLDRRRLLPALAHLAGWRGTALNYRTLAGLQLQAGAPQAALQSLKIASERRRADSPPIEELLLALVHHRLGQHDQARRHLDRVRAWRSQVMATLRAVTLTNATAAHPLASLAISIAPVGDPRFDTFDAFTRVEFDVLFEQAEKTLATALPPPPRKR
jgi:WD40 repeat protein